LADFIEIQIEAGATFNIELLNSDVDGSAINLAGFSVYSQLRKSYYSTEYTDFEINVVDASNGIIQLELSAEVTSNIRPGRYVFDAIAENTSNVVIRLIEGIATVKPSATKK